MKASLRAGGGRCPHAVPWLGAQVVSFAPGTARPPSCTWCGDKSGLSGYPLWASHTQPGSQDEGSFLSSILALKDTGTPWHPAEFVITPG